MSSIRMSLHSMNCVAQLTLGIWIINASELLTSLRIPYVAANCLAASSCSAASIEMTAKIHTSISRPLI